MAVAVVESGRHLWIEKPAGRNAEETAQIVTAVARAGVQSAAGVNYRTFNIVAVSAAEVLKNDPGAMGGLIYNPRAASVSGPSGTFSGPLFDPTAIMFVYASDLTYVGGRPRLSQSYRREPLILRANAGECIKATLKNDIPLNYADTPGYTGVNMIVEDFNQNEVKTSMSVRNDIEGMPVQLYVEGTFGATRLQEKLLVELPCNEA